MNLNGDFKIEIWYERIGWWQYCINMEKTFKYSSKRLSEYLTKKYTVSEEWSIKSFTLPIIRPETADAEKWKKFYLGEWTDEIKKSN